MKKKTQNQIVHSCKSPTKVFPVKVLTHFPFFKSQVSMSPLYDPDTSFPSMFNLIQYTEELCPYNVRRQVPVSIDHNFMVVS